MDQIKKLAFSFLFCLLTFAAYSQRLDTTRINYSPNTRVTLLTCSPGTQVYAAFGHTSIRVVDPVKNIDLVYNYGIFNFNTPNFYLKFARGMLKYMVARYPTRFFLREFQREKRRVLEQEINLTPDEKRQFLAVLEDNYIDPNKRYYLYDFFYNNCSSKVRDMLKKEFNPIMPKEEKSDTTFRQMLDVYIADQPWIDLGIDLLLGVPVDKKADAYNQMFLPDYLYYNMSKWKKQSGEFLLGKPRDLVAGSAKITYPAPGWNQPLYVFWALFGVALLVTFLIKSRGFKRFLDGFFLLIVGLAGTVLLFMWVGTNHDATQVNLNVLWANPLYFFLAFAVWFNRGIKLTFRMMLLVNVLLLASWMFFPQKFHFSLIPIFLLMIVRAVDHLFLMRQRG